MVRPGPDNSDVRGLAGAGVFQLETSCNALRRVARTLALGRHLRVGWDLAVSPLGHGLDLTGGHVATDDEDGVIRRVVVLVKGQRVVLRKLGHLVLPANDRDAVVVVHVQRGVHLLVEQSGRVVLDARAAFLEDDVALGDDLFFGKAEVDHAVGLHPHHGLQAVRGDALEVSRDVMAGEGVVLAAKARDNLGELAHRNLVRGLEHQVLEEVSDAGDAGGLISGPDAYQTIWVTTGARLSGTTTTSMPLASVNCVARGAA